MSQILIVEGNKLKTQMTLLSHGVSGEITSSGFEYVGAQTHE